MGGLFSYLYRYFVQVGGAHCFFTLGSCFLDRKLPLINYLGTRTLGIYAFQFVVLHYFSIKMDTFLSVFLTTALCLFISVLCVEIVHRIKYLRLLLIGEI